METAWNHLLPQGGDNTDLWNMIARWLHVTAGVTWIGLLYFFNFINGHFQSKLSPEVKRSVVPELMPRALFWFRWGAAFTWITGAVLFLLIYWGKSAMYQNGLDGSLSGRAVWIMLGAAFGTIMAFNVWFIIWPAQKVIIPKVKAGESPDPALGRRATLASKVNTYLSVPLLMIMVSNSIPTLFDQQFLGSQHLFLLLVVVIGFVFVKLWYAIAPRIQGV